MVDSRKTGHSFLRESDVFQAPCKNSSGHSQAHGAEQATSAREKGHNPRWSMLLTGGYVVYTIPECQQKTILKYRYVEAAFGHTDRRFRVRWIPI
jgi:hypothetical protein